jgi:hypothetical protein
VSRSVGPAVDPTVLAALAWARIMRGRPIGPRTTRRRATYLPRRIRAGPRRVLSPVGAGRRTW